MLVAIDNDSRFHEMLYRVNAMLREQQYDNEAIAEKLKTSSELVKSQRKFLGIPEPVVIKYKRRVVEPITDPDEYFALNPDFDPDKHKGRFKRPKRLPAAPKLNNRIRRSDVWALQKEIAIKFDSGIDIKRLAYIYKCSNHLIRCVLGIS